MINEILVPYIEDGSISEFEIIEFLRTLKKLSETGFLIRANYDAVLCKFGFKEKKGWIIVDKKTKYKI
jgi:hypothetical protein